MPRPGDEVRLTAVVGDPPVVPLAFRRNLLRSLCQIPETRPRQTDRNPTFQHATAKREWTLAPSVWRMTAQCQKRDLARRAASGAKRTLAPFEEGCRGPCADGSGLVRRIFAS